MGRLLCAPRSVPWLHSRTTQRELAHRLQQRFELVLQPAWCCLPCPLAGGKRTNWESSGGSRKTLNQLLTDMDGFEENRWAAPPCIIGMTGCSSLQECTTGSQLTSLLPLNLTWALLTRRPLSSQLPPPLYCSGIVVMAATNLPELLDTALTRPGRFDRQVGLHEWLSAGPA